MTKEQIDEITKQIKDTKEYNVGQNIIKEMIKYNAEREQIKLDKDQSLAFKNFASVCKPDDVTDHDFIKTIFLTGVEAMNKELASLVQQYAKANKEELAASGITVLEDEDGKIQLAESQQFSGEPTVQDSVLHDDAIREVMDKE